MLRTALPEIVTGSVPGPKAKEIIDRRAAAVPGAIRCAYPVAIARGEGAMIEDVDGNRFLDWIGGVGVLNIGFSHPEIVEAVKAQADKYFHGMFNIVTHEGYVALAEKLAQIVPVKGDSKKVFFANSGAEADENAVKVARAYTGRPNIIAMTGAFHGRTMLTMTMTAKKAYTTGMGPLVNGVFRAKFPYLYRSPAGMSEAEVIQSCVDSIQDLFEEACQPDTVAAIILEPLQGEGGFIPAPIEFVKALRQICDQHGIMLIADEVQSGFCRTGRMFASEYWAEAGCAPDILTTAKSIAAGMPISAIVARSEIMDAIPGGTVGGTFCGNPLACAAGLKTIEIMERDNLAARSREIGEKVTARAKVWQEKYGVLGNIRGLGAMIGLEFVKDMETKEPNGELVSAMVQACVQRGLMIEPAGRWGQVVRFLAPLVITDEQLEKGLDLFEEALVECLKA
ncbi:aspartate aminotransferase family protein [Evtepia sp.]|uniref:aspartate aminotransferase family protein n=1 Tax=Evtepia sp. TaxID=2773933 RepID=UPI003F15AC98